MSITLQIFHFSLPLSLFQLPQLLLDLRLPVFHILPFAAREQAIYMGQFCFNSLLFRLQNGDSINPPLLRVLLLAYLFQRPLCSLHRQSYQTASSRMHRIDHRYLIHRLPPYHRISARPYISYRQQFPRYLSSRIHYMRSSSSITFTLCPTPANVR